MALLNTVFYALFTLLGLRISPDSPPTDGKGATRICTGLEVHDGIVNCANYGLKTVCYVTCHSVQQAEFTCTEIDGWYPQLPDCARPIQASNDHDDKDDHDYDQAEVERHHCPNGKCTDEDGKLVAATRGCPQRRLCDQYCRNHGSMYGHCDARNNCICHSTD